MEDAEHSTTAAAPTDGAELARGWLQNSPFVSHLGIAVDALEPDRAVLSMPFRNRSRRWVMSSTAERSAR